MMVPESTYLNAQIPALKELVARLQEEYPYVSVLGTDVAGKQYRVQKTGIQVNDSSWAERGFVARLYNGRNYAEVSFNEFDPGELDFWVAAIKNRARNPLHGSRFSQSSYPVIAEAEICRSYQGEAGVLAEAVSPERILAQMEAIKEKGLALPGPLVDIRVIYEAVHVAKLFLSAKKELRQSYLWSQGYLIPLVRRDGITKYFYDGFSGLKGSELLAEMEADCPNAVAKAVRLLDAGSIAPGEYDVICAPEIAGLIAHEAFGHGVETDMFVKNRAKAVTYLGKPVASPKVSMRDGAAAASHVSSYWFDDEGTPGSDTVIIEDGILRTGISDLLSALRLGTAPTGNGKRESFERKAYARMTNTFFDAGRDRLEDMIASIQFGYLLDGSLSGMEDPKNWGIQCVALLGEEIRDGKLSGKIVSPVIMTGYVPDLLQSITMVSDRGKLSGGGACGKGHKEYCKVSDGGPYLKTRARLG